MSPQNISNKISLAFSKEDCATIEQLAKEMNLSTMRVRQIIADGFKKRVIQKIAIKDGVRVLYPEPMIKQIKAHYQNSTGKRVKTAPLEQTAELLVKVPVFDEEAKAILLRRFGTPEKIVDFLKEKLAEQYKPMLNELQTLERDYLERKAQLLSA